MSIDEPFAFIPSRPFKSWKAYSSYIKNQSYGRDYPCRSCWGYGQWKNPKERDPIEGFKLVSFSLCPACNGSGEADPAEYQKLYNDLIKRWRKDVRKAKLQNQALAKLTKAERNALGFI